LEHIIGSQGFGSFDFKKKSGNTALGLKLNSENEFLGINDFNFGV